MKKKKKTEGLILPNFNTYYRLQSSRWWVMEERTDIYTYKWNRTVSKNRIIHTVSSAIMLVLKMQTCSNAIDTLGNNSSRTLIWVLNFQFCAGLCAILSAWNTRWNTRKRHVADPSQIEVHTCTHLKHLPAISAHHVLWVPLVHL